MDPVTHEITIARPREEVFAYLADIANHPEFSDHYLKDWRLLRVDSYGRGAGARFRADAPFRRFEWADLSFAEIEPPRRIVAFGRGGKFNRVKSFAEWVLEPAGATATRVTFTYETEPAMLSDRLSEALGLRSWWRRRTRKALRRLQSILEDGEDRGARATIAGR